MINLELPPNIENQRQMMREVAKNVFRPISRKYDEHEHEDPVELKALGSGAGRSSRPPRDKSASDDSASPADTADGKQVVNGRNMNSVVTVSELSWGDVGLMLSMPGAGLGNAAISSVATDEQKARFGSSYAAMAITEPGTGSDSSNIDATAVLDGDEWVINGEKIFVTAGGRCDAVVVWATLDRSKGKAAIKSFVVPKGTKGMEVVRLEHKLGIRASDTAAITFTDCRIPKDNILGTPEIEDSKAAFGGVMQTFDNTRPTIAAMGVGVARAALDLTYELLQEEGFTLPYDKSLYNASALEAELYRMEADLEGARLLVLKAAWLADNNVPNSMEASMCKAKAGRVGNHITLRCVELCGSLGYSEQTLLEKFARDSKIIDIFEGTQQIQQLIVARKLLNKSSNELK